MIQAPSDAWVEDCKLWRGKTLEGKWAHWCCDWDGLPIDETCPEWPCPCAKDPEFIKSCEEAGHPELPHWVEPERICRLDHDALQKECTDKKVPNGECPDCGRPFFIFGTWYPIETAPRKTPVIISVDSGREPSDWNSIHVAQLTDSSVGNGWQHGWVHTLYQNLGPFVSGKPTHWMPRPPKP